jgi:hypothetical protein
MIAFKLRRTILSKNLRLFGIMLWAKPATMILPHTRIQSG